MIKVIASDMDGTLLGDDHRIAPETLAAIRRACDAGIRFMVATGRNFPALQKKSRTFWLQERQQAESTEETD